MPSVTLSQHDKVSHYILNRQHASKIRPIFMLWLSQRLKNGVFMIAT